jgi:hypothetical protein
MEILFVSFISLFQVVIPHGGFATNLPYAFLSPYMGYMSTAYSIPLGYE